MSGDGEGTIDVLTIGEALVDLISTEPAQGLSEAEQFRRYQGGSPANLAANVLRLGGRATVVCKLGTDGFGTFVAETLERGGLSTRYVVWDEEAPTTVVFVTRTTGSPDFSAYRGADARLRPDEVSPEAIAACRVLHSTSFALSREPCRSAVIESFRAAREAGKILSFDPNYRDNLVPDRQEALAAMARLYRDVDVTKPSLDDAAAIFGATLPEEEILRRFHEMGPEVVVLTMGHRGSLVSDPSGVTHVPVRPVPIADSTGAGDAFWAGFLMARLDGYDPVAATYAAREVVELKLQVVGPLVQKIDRPSLYRQAEAARAAS